MREWRPWQHVLIGFLLGAVIAFGIVWMASQPRGAMVTLSPLPTSGPLQIHVAGAVRNPGLYSLEPGSRTAKAIEMAGGLTQDANSDAVNLAMVLRDGQQVYIPRRGEEEPANLQTDRTGLIDLNTATLAELMELPGIGPDRAQDILDYRMDHNGFKQVEELMEVPGIGEATFERLQPLVTIVQ